MANERIKSAGLGWVLVFLGGQGGFRPPMEGGWDGAGGSVVAGSLSPDLESVVQYYTASRPLQSLDQGAGQPRGLETSALGSPVNCISARPSSQFPADGTRLVRRCLEE